jgi:hypothetical protein
MSERLHPFLRWWGCAMHSCLSVFTQTCTNTLAKKNKRIRIVKKRWNHHLMQLTYTRCGFWYWQHGIKELHDNLEQCSQNSMSHIWSSVSLYKKKHTPSSLTRPVQKGVSGKGLAVSNGLRNSRVRQNYALGGVVCDRRNLPHAVAVNCGAWLRRM